MRFASIASGSSGNCVYAGDDNTHIIIDAGISNRRIEGGLKELGLNATDLSGICITHEHSDHISGLAMFLKKHPVLVYATKETLDRIRPYLAGIPSEDFLHPILPDEVNEVGSLKIQAFSISHDAANPVAYRVTSGKKAVAVATDMGYYSPYTVEHLQHLDALLLESNHDIHMLESGPYPYYLKRRIAGDKGHLSNETAGRLLTEILHDDLKHILLGHISKENNFPDLAYEAVRLEIDLGFGEYKGKDFDIQVASRDHMSEIFEV